MSVGTGPHVLAFDWGWGHLPHHDQTCGECDGTGEVDDDGCPDCDGDGEFRWGSFYVQDKGDCDHCKRAEIPIAEMFQDTWVCLPCYVASHKSACGCDRWADVERVVSVGTAFLMPAEHCSAPQSSTEKP